MKVFIENESKSKQKNIYNEKTLTFIKTIEVGREYPFPYGFVLDTTAEDGDNIDVFIITNKALKKGQIVECEPIGLMEQYEKSWDLSKSMIEEIDHNVLAVLKGEEKEMTELDKNRLIEFVTHVFDNIQKNKTRVGQFLNRSHAIQYIENHKDPKI